MPPPDPSLLALARRVLPAADVPHLGDASVVRGEFHDVLLLPGRGVVKIARGAAAAHLPRRVALLERLGRQALPFRTPVPLGEVTREGERAAVALSWVEGSGTPAAAVTASRLRHVLEAIASVRVDAVADVLDRPHAYAGRENWATLLLDGVVPRLPPDLWAPAADRVHAALDLDPVRPRLVHGDLAGDNLRWSPDGDLIGVIDWDLAHADDPAVDAACLGNWFGWDTLGAAVDGQTLRRARVWRGTFDLEHVASALDNGEPESVIAARVERTVGWLRAASPVAG